MGKKDNDNVTIVKESEGLATIRLSMDRMRAQFKRGILALIILGSAFPVLALLGGPSIAGFGVPFSIAMGFGFAGFMYIVGKYSPVLESIVLNRNEHLVQARYGYVYSDKEKNETFQGQALGRVETMTYRSRSHWISLLYLLDKDGKRVFVFANQSREKVDRVTALISELLADVERTG